MLVINYKGITPQQRFYSHAVKGNNNANEIKFIVERYQNDLDLASLTPYLKVSNKCENYFDKIALSLTSDDDFVYLVWTMTSKSTQYRNLELQLQFQSVEVVFQTQIVELELNETIPAEKHIEEEHPTAIKQIEDELDDHEKRIEQLEEDVEGKVDKTTQASKVYGTDENGNQTLYPKDSFGQVEDVKVNGESVVTDKVAEIDLTDYAKESDLQAETERATGVEEGLEDRIKDVEDLIPAQATPQNKLADKDFVNSSIATNTAYFKGTFNVVTDLSLTIEATHEQIATAIASVVSNPTNNDYVFVSFPDPIVPSEYTKFSRYKYNSETETWAFEFDLNNSSFTAQQWASINSGITAEQIANFVTTNTEQTITGDKNHTGALQKNGVDVATTDILSFKKMTHSQWSSLSVDERIEQIQRGLIITGTLTISGQNIVNPTFLPPSGRVASGWYGVLLCQRNYEENRFLIYNFTNHNGMFGLTNNDYLILEKIGRINGISINHFYKKPQSSVSLSDGGTITDNNLKSLIQNEQPIKLNEHTCYFSCDDGTNYQYVSTRYDSVANKNHINVITIDKSTWVATFHTSDIAVN